VELAISKQLPAYARLMNDIRERISSGSLQPGHRLASVREPAKQWGLSQATVSHAYAELARDGVLRPEHGRGVFVSQPPDPSELPIGLLGVFEPEQLASRRGFVGEFAIGINEAIAEAGRQLLIMGAVRHEELGREQLRKLGGAVIFENFSPEEIVGFQRLGLPFVLADMDLTLAGIDPAVTDNAGGLATGVRELARRGGERFCYVQIGRAYRGRWDPALDDRAEGFRLATAALDLPAELITPPGRGVEAGRAAAEEILRNEQRPDAVLCFDHAAARGVVDRLRAAGVRVPEEVQVVGFGSWQPTDAHYGEIAYIDFDAAELGRQAIALLLRRQREPHAEVHRARIAAQWVPGASVRPLS